MAQQATLYSVDRTLIDALVSRLERRLAFSVSIADRELFIALGTENLSGAVVGLSLW
jgi:hypothetical protein